jgi:hypothetical protein
MPARPQQPQGVQIINLWVPGLDIAGQQATYPHVVLQHAPIDARLFTGPRGGRISTSVLRDATHRDDVVTRLGYERLRRHDLRHTGLTGFAVAEVQVHLLRRIFRHGSPTTTQRHLHPGVHKITVAEAALPAHLSVLCAPRSPPSPIVVTR